MAVPEKGFGRIAARMQSDTVEKSRIEACTHSHRRLPVAGIGSALVKKPCRCEITGMEEGITPGQEFGDLSDRKDLGGRRGHSSNR